MIAVDHILRIVVVILACLFIIRYASLYEEEYNKKLIDLYVCPWWRILIIFMLIASAYWCPTVSIVIALLTFFYLSDMNTLIAPLSF
jgi:hypothetical protein